MPGFPGEGVCMANEDERAFIENTSTFLQRVRQVPVDEFVAMDIEKLPSGLFKVARLHPVVSRLHLEKLVVALSVARAGMDVCVCVW